MEDKYKSADLILKLYELRREEKMREARNFFLGFFPNSAQEIIQVMISAETSANYRMVSSYWDMAATMVNHGAIDAAMFADAHGEHIVVFSKIQPYLSEIREMMGNPGYLKNLEQLIMSMPDAEALLTARREMIKSMMAARAEMTKST